MCICCVSQDISGCNTAPVDGAESGDDSLVYLCSALSREDGIFSFPSLASGDYTVVRWPPQHTVLFTLHLSHGKLALG